VGFLVRPHSISIRILLNQVLCISCPSATEFLPDRAQTHLDHFNVLGELLCQISFKSEGVKNFSIDPHCKNWPLRQCYNVAESGQFLQRGFMGKFFIRCRIQLKFCLGVRLKLRNDQGEFELDQAKS